MPSINKCDNCSGYPLMCDQNTWGDTLCADCENRRAEHGGREVDPESIAAKNKNKCSCCKNEGHNKRTCPIKPTLILTVANIAPAVNQATVKMLQATISYEIEGMAGDHPPVYTASQLRNYWQQDIRLHSDDYEQSYFALIATPSIEATIDWAWIAQRLPSYAALMHDGKYCLHSMVDEMLIRDGYKA